MRETWVSMVVQTLRGNTPARKGEAYAFCPGNGAHRAIRGCTPRANANTPKGGAQ